MRNTDEYSYLTVHVRLSDPDHLGRPTMACFSGRPFDAEAQEPDGYTYPERLLGYVQTTPVSPEDEIGALLDAFNKRARR